MNDLIIPMTRYTVFPRVQTALEAKPPSPRRHNVGAKYIVIQTWSLGRIQIYDHTRDVAMNDDPLLVMWKKTELYIEHN